MDSSARAESLEEGYERLRREVLSTNGRVTPAPGLGVFVRQGMVAWMKVYSLCGTTIALPPPRRSSDAVQLPRGLVGDVTTILAGMVIARKEFQL